MNEELLKRLSNEHKQNIARAIIGKSDLSIFARRDVLETHAELKRLVDNDLSKAYELDAAISAIEPKNYSEFQAWCKDKGLHEMSQEALAFLHDIASTNSEFFNK